MMPHIEVIRFHVNTITDQILKDKDTFPETTYEYLVPCTSTANVQTGFDGKINCSSASLGSGFQMASNTGLDIKQERKEKKRTKKKV